MSKSNQNESPVEPAPTPPPPSHTKFIIGIVTIFLLVVIVIGAYIVSQPKTELSDIEVVTNKETSPVTITPSSAWCGIKKRNVTAKTAWVETPENCNDELLETDLLSYTLLGSDIKIDQIPAVEIRFDFDLSDSKITMPEVVIEMTCKADLVIYNMTELSEWEPVDTTNFYYKCNQWSNTAETVTIVPIIFNNSSHILITPGTGDSVGHIDSVSMSILKTAE